jgi:hypothetical protein
MFCCHRRIVLLARLRAEAATACVASIRLAPYSFRCLAEQRSRPEQLPAVDQRSAMLSGELPKPDRIVIPERHQDRRRAAVGTLTGAGRARRPHLMFKGLAQPDAPAAAAVGSMPDWYTGEAAE